MDKDLLIPRGSNFATLRGSEALARLLKYDDVRRVLDVGSGEGEHARLMRAAGREVTTISMLPPADHLGDYTSDIEIPEAPFDAIWACHVLEHQRNVGLFLQRCFRDLRDGGVLAITVPPPKWDIVGGHLSLWNQGLLLYQLILAGFDCREARVSPLYADIEGGQAYNLSVLVRKAPARLPLLTFDEGDIERLAEFFPVPVSHGFDGRMDPVNWDREFTPPEPPPPSVGLHIAIVALGPSAEGYMDHVKRLGSRQAFADQVWGINAIGSILSCDLVWHMDDVRIQEIRAKANPRSNIAAMLAWLKTTSVPVMTSFKHPDYPALQEFPLEDVVNRLGRGYFNNTAAYAVAYAIHIGAKKISLFGCDFTYPDAHKAERGRACVEFWLGYAAKEGILIATPTNTSLLDALDDQDETDIPSYGYDAVKISCTRAADGTMKLTMTPRSKLPTAAEIEAAYDHGKHPLAQSRPAAAIQGK